jgi:hypothetical protein
MKRFINSCALSFAAVLFVASGQVSFAGLLYVADSGSGNIYDFAPAAVRSMFAFAVPEPCTLVSGATALACICIVSIRRAKSLGWLGNSHQLEMAIGRSHNPWRTGLNGCVQSTRSPCIRS